MSLGLRENVDAGYFILMMIKVVLVMFCALVDDEAHRTSLAPPRFSGVYNIPHKHFPSDPKKSFSEKDKSLS